MLLATRNGVNSIFLHNTLNIAKDLDLVFKYLQINITYDFIDWSTETTETVINKHSKNNVVTINVYLLQMYINTYCFEYNRKNVCEVFFTCYTFSLQQGVMYCKDEVYLLCSFCFMWAAMWLYIIQLVVNNLVIFICEVIVMI